MPNAQARVWPTYRRLSASEPRPVRQDRGGSALRPGIDLGLLRNFPGCVELHPAVIGKLGSEPPLRELNSITEDARKMDLRCRPAFVAENARARLGRREILRRIGRHEVEGTPRTSAYSGRNIPWSSGSYDTRRSARPTTCSQSSRVPKARQPRIWVTVLASQPSVNIDTDTTQRTGPPSLPFCPTVFITSRSTSASVVALGSRPGVRASSLRNASISSAATSLKASEIASPLSSSCESIKIVRGRSSGLPSCILLKVRGCRRASAA